jgi:hypothetical protein
MPTHDVFDFMSSSRVAHRALARRRKPMAAAKSPKRKTEKSRDRKPASAAQRRKDEVKGGEKANKTIRRERRDDKKA